MKSFLAAHAGRWLGVGLAVSLLFVPGTAAADPPSVPTYTFSGGGYGHGTGMSQYGAQGQALAGRTWEQILSTYFTDVDFAELKAELLMFGGVDEDDGKISEIEFEILVHEQEIAKLNAEE